jgi:NAD(P)-dependent dehydrogenase (short-subunit alcohol dehydrogenase family)
VRGTYQVVHALLPLLTVDPHADRPELGREVAAEADERRLGGGVVVVGDDALIAQTPLRRLATPQDVAGPVLFLAHDDSRFMTGATQLTRTPTGPSSAARLRLKPTSAALAVV